MTMVIKRGRRGVKTCVIICQYFEGVATYPWYYNCIVSANISEQVWNKNNNV